MAGGPDFDLAGTTKKRVAGGPDFDLAGTSNKRVPRPLRFLQRAGVGNVNILEHGVAAQGDK